MKNRNLFIELNLPEEKDFKETLINSWTKPVPLEFHLLNSPSLTQELSLHVPKENLRHTFDQNIPPERGSRYTIKKLSKERKKYIRLEEQLEFLQQFLAEFKDLHESQLLLYKQTLLVKYLNGFLKEIQIECHEKSQFLKAIWNTLIKIFQQLFERVIRASTKKQFQMLSGEIQLHSSYQQKLQELKRHNEMLVATESKYKGAINQLMDSVATVNMELKGTKTLQQKSVTTIRTLSQKYEELKADYLDIVVSTGVTRAEAERNLHDKQLLLFSKQIAHHEIDVKVKPKPGRKGKIINEKIDVGLILEEIEAEEEFQFEIDSQEKKEIRYSNQKIQTDPENTIITCDKSIQSTFKDLAELKIIRQRGVQTAREEKNDARINARTQTDAENSIQTDLSIFKCYEFKIKFQVQDKIEKSLSRKELQQSSHQTQFSQTMLNHLSEALKQSDRRPEATSMYLTKSVSSAAENERKPVKKSREGKMFRVGESSRFSKMMPQQRLKTEGGLDSENTPSVNRFSQTKKISEFIILEQVRKKIIGKWSKFRQQSKKSNFFTEMKSQIPRHLEGKGIMSSIAQTEDAFFQRSPYYIQNTQVNLANSHFVTAIRGSPHHKKPVVAGKMLKIVADILQEFNRFINQNVYSFDIVSFAIEYLAALKGQYFDSHAKKKLFVQFIKSCAPLAVGSYLVRNFFLLCGFPFSKADYRVSKFGLKLKEPEEEGKAIKFMFYSEILTYFRILAKANCDTSQNLLQAFTNVHVMVDSLEEIKKLYRNSQPLLQEIVGSIKKSAENTGDADPKLDIFKTLHFVLEKIIEYKQKIAQRLEPLAILYGQLDLNFFDEIVSVVTDNPAQRIKALGLYRSSYGANSNLQNISTYIIIEGHHLNLLPFQEIQTLYKFTILKKLMYIEKSNSPLVDAMLKALHKKQLKRTQFLCLLRLLWTKHSEDVCETVLGDDLTSLYTVSVSQTLPKAPTEDFHSLAFGG